jgi:hypothetical protein
MISLHSGRFGSAWLALLTPAGPSVAPLSSETSGGCTRAKIPCGLGNNHRPPRRHVIVVGQYRAVFHNGHESMGTLSVITIP